MSVVFVAIQLLIQMYT